MATVVEECKISPPSDAATKFSLPILFFDMIWFQQPATQMAFFYEIPGCSKSYFLETIVPALKHSVSLMLGQFLPLVGEIVHPLNQGRVPIIRYTSGRDSVHFRVAESSADIHHFYGNHARSADEFYAFVPELPPAIIDPEDSIRSPVLALQVTLFLGQGLCIGIAAHHVVADASTIACFMRAWAVICYSRSRGGEDAEAEIRSRLTEAKCLPFYDRQTVADINGLDSLYWDLLLKQPYSVETLALKLPIGKIRTTIVLKKDEIQKLKNYVNLSKPTYIGSQVNMNNRQISSFTVACALVLSCSAKSAAAGGEEVADEESEHLVFPVDCRRRLNPPLPENYFGNCVALFDAEMKHGDLKGEDGFVMAVETIGNVIRDKVYGDKGVLHGADRWPKEFEKLVGKRVYGVSGSPRFDFYATDYGWGKPKKVEFLSNLDASTRSFSLSNSREFEGGLEIGLSKPMLQMKAFNAIFTKVLADLLG